jgi:hypothetical protein
MTPYIGKLGIYEEKKMKKVLFLLLALLFLYNCGGSGGNGDKDEGLKFIETSGGIPQNMQFRENITFCDLDGDGLKDMITPAPRPEYTSPKVFLNKNNSWLEITEQCSFPPEVNFYGWVEADSSGNLYFAIHGRSIFALKRTGFCSWENASDGLPPVGEFSSRALAIGDINQDGLIDIAAISDDFYTQPRTVRVFAGNGNFVWADASNGLPEMISGDHISLADLNGDGHTDILVDNNNQSSNSVVWFGDSSGTWIDGGGNLPEGLYFSDTPFNKSLFCMLFNETFTGGPLLFKLDNGSWNLSTDTGLPDSSYISAIAIADLNQDGLEDIILGDNSSMTLRIFSGTGEFSFNETLSLPLPSDQGSIWNITVSDINMDGNPDIAVNMASADNLGTIRIFLQK